MIRFLTYVAVAFSWAAIAAAQSQDMAAKGREIFKKHQNTVITVQLVVKSKFGGMPLFAKSNIGYLTLQGDHGQVSFRNIKIRRIEARAL